MPGRAQRVDGPLRVMRIIARMNVGGPALQITELSRSLDPARFEQRLYVGATAVGEAEYLELRAPDVEVRRIVGLGRSPRPLDDLRALAGLHREMRRFRPHIVHTHTAKAGVLGRVAAWVNRVPVTVHTFHGHLLHGYFSPAVSKLVAVAERLLATRTSHLVAVGDRVRDELLAAGIGRRSDFSVVSPGVSLPTPPERQEARDALGLPPDGTVVAFVGRLTGVKRPDRFVEVARRAVARRDDLVFVVCGEGPMLAEAQREAAELGSRVRFVGWRADVEVVYAASDIVLLTSDNEGMPVSLIEASLCGRPCVATDVGSVGQVVLHEVTGLVVEPQVEALVTAVLSLAADPVARTTMGGAAQRHAAERFGAARLVDDMAAIYDAEAAAAGLR